MDATEGHHMIRKSKNQALKECKMNIAPLCSKCHFHLHHMEGGKKLETKLQLEFQNRLEMKLLKDKFTKEELKGILKINDKAIDRLLKTTQHKNDLYTRESILIACIGRILSTEDIE